MLKTFMHKLLPAKKIHAQPKGEKEKNHSPENCPPPLHSLGEQD